MTNQGLQLRSVEPTTLRGAVDRLVVFKAGHERVMIQLSHVQDQQLAPYCELLAERIQNQVLPVIEDAIEAANILQHEAAPGLTEFTRDRLWSLLQKAASLPPVEGVDSS